jgi:hypothetical protein
VLTGILPTDSASLALVRSFGGLLRLGELRRIPNNTPVDAGLARSDPPLSIEGKDKRTDSLGICGILLAAGRQHDYVSGYILFVATIAATTFVIVTGRASSLTRHMMGVFIGLGYWEHLNRGEGNFFLGEGVNGATVYDGFSALVFYPS